MLWQNVTSLLVFLGLKSILLENMGGYSALINTAVHDGSNEQVTTLCIACCACDIIIQ